MTEYVIVFPVMIVLIFGTLQFALLYHTKTQLNYAAFESARSGSLNNAQDWALNAGLVRGLAPIHTHGASRQWLRWARSKVWDEIDAGLIEIQMLSPTQVSFETFDNDPTDSDWIIPNSHLMYRDASIIASEAGNPGQNIQDANLLKIRVMYCAEMHVPFVNRMINSLLRLGATGTGTVPTGTGPVGSVGTGQLSAGTTTAAAGYTAPAGSFEFNCLNRHTTIAENWRRYIPIVSQAIIRMQTPAIRTPTP